MTSFTRRDCLAISALATIFGSVAPQAARAQAPAWPSRPVRVIVPVAAGTATDLTARFFGERLSALWGQSIVVENRPGADGLVALGGFVQARDDHTLLFSFSTAVSLNPLIHSKLPYDAAIDLVPITTTTEVLFGIAVHTDVPASTMADFGTHVRANPGKLNWAAAPSLPRFVLERHRREQKLDMAYVHYNQTGTGVQDLGEGRIQAMIGSISTLMPILEAKKAKMIAIASMERSSLATDVQSAKDAGYPELIVPAVGCVYGWTDIPSALRDRIASDVDRVAQEPDLVARLDKIGQVVKRSSPDQLAALLATQRVELAPLAATIATLR
jgi:tripartite-type tricarboxylate transporter receptor subunit TctC